MGFNVDAEFEQLRIRHLNLLKIYKTRKFNTGQPSSPTILKNEIIKSKVTLGNRQVKFNLDD